MVARLVQLATMRGLARCPGGGLGTAPSSWSRAIPAQPGTPLAAGYRVIEHLSRGTDLDVYDAWSEEREARCVLKTLRPDRVAAMGRRSSLRLEGGRLRRLSHPHLVRAYEMVESLWHESPVVVLETLSGETLAHLMDRLSDSGRRMSPGDAAQLGMQLCAMAGYLHRNGLLHLDLKPGNIVVETGRAIVIDLSIARPPGRAPGGRGTEGYMAPEQVRGGELSGAADVWAIGTILFEGLVGRLPLDKPSAQTQGRSGAVICRPGAVGLGPPVGSLRRLPHAMASIIDACLEPRPADRPTAPEVRATLAHLVAEESAVAAAW